MQDESIIADSTPVNKTKSKHTKQKMRGSAFEQLQKANEMLIEVNNSIQDPVHHLQSICQENSSDFNNLFDDDQKYYESVSVDLEQEEFNKLQYYKNIINHLIENVEAPKQQ